MKAQPDIQENTLEHTHSTDESRETDKQLSLPLLLESLARSIAGKIEADVMTSESGELDEVELEELISNYAKESVKNILDRAAFSEQFLVEKLDSDEEGSENEEKRQASDQLVQESLQSKEMTGSSQENGLHASTEGPEVPTETTNPKDKTSHSQGRIVNMCIYMYVRMYVCMYVCM